MKQYQTQPTGIFDACIGDCRTEQNGVGMVPLLLIVVVSFWISRRIR
ncbi:MAG: hypothetical protein SNJ81_16075 [Cyanobacteriota bacterium]